MSQRLQRDFRKQASKVATQTVQAMAPGIEAAIQNEQITRQRVEALEDGLKGLIDYAEKTELLTQDLANWRLRPFLGRLRWLFTGR